QAATLITRALALRQVTPGEWWKVMRHELIMGLALGAALGGIGFVRASFTREATLRNDEERKDPFEVHPLAGQAITQDMEGKYLIPPGALQYVGKRFKGESQIAIPSGSAVQAIKDQDGTTQIYRFPANTIFSTAQV